MNSFRLAAFAVGLVLVSSFAFAEDDPPKPNERPNVLWLIAEDFGPHLGCYGTPEVESPNLDALAQRGQRYDRFFTTAPVCSASRSAFMTGMYQTTIGAHHHRSHRSDGYRLPGGAKVLTDRLRDAGYFTANIRKFPDAVGFKGTGKTDWNFAYDGKPFDSDDWSDLAKNQPFYAQVNFHETHRNFNGPEVADPDRVEIPPYYPDHPVVRDDWARYLDAASELDRKIGRILAQLKKDGLADDTIVVFFGDHGSAHVRGKQFCYDSGLHIPFILYVPPRFQPMAGYETGSVDDRLHEAIDLTAQTLAWAGVATPEGMQGRTFLGEDAAPEREYAFAARDRCDETPFRLRTARDERYRYIRNFTPDRPMLLRNDYKEKQYPVWNLMKELAAKGELNEVQSFLTADTMPPEELYDVQAHPHETVNLVDSANPEHQAALKRMRAAVVEWIDESHDAGADDDYSYDPAWAAGKADKSQAVSP